MHVPGTITHLNLPAFAGRGGSIMPSPVAPGPSVCARLEGAAGAGATDAGAADDGAADDCRTAA
jgi:hypothetical protein